MTAGDPAGADLVIREIDTGEEVSRVRVTNLAESHVERVIWGLLINLGERFLVDDSEVEAAQRKRRFGG